MAKHFDLRKQLKLHDKGLLRRLFAKHEELLDFPWDSLKPHDVEPLVEQWEGIKKDKRRQVQVILQDVNELVDERGHKVLTEDLEWRYPEKLATFEVQKRLLDEAL